MSLIKCPDCSQGVSTNAESCPNCGFPIAKHLSSLLPNTVICLECKKEFPFNDHVCPYCGLFNSQKYQTLKTSGIHESEPQASPDRPMVLTSQKNRSTAVLLAMVLGGLGMHKFYLNKPGMGVFYLLFCWTFIPAIVGFIEGLIYLTMDDATFQKRHAA